MSLPEVLRALRASRRPGLPVITEHGEYVGVVTAVGAAAAVGDDDADTVTVSQLIEWRDYVAPDDPIEDVLAVLLGEEVYDGVPVLDSEGNVVGWLRRDAVLRRMTVTRGHPQVARTPRRSRRALRRRLARVVVPERPLRAGDDGDQADDRDAPEQRRAPQRRRRVASSPTYMSPMRGPPVTTTMKTPCSRPRISSGAA